MEGFRRTIGFPAVAALLMFAAVMVQETAAARYTVGDRGWVPNVNYTIWAQGHHFYNGDWLCMLSGHKFKRVRKSQGARTQSNSAKTRGSTNGNVSLTTTAPVPNSQNARGSTRSSHEDGSSGHVSSNTRGTSMANSKESTDDPEYDGTYF